MKRLVAIVCVLSAAACLPTRNGTPFNDGGDAGPNNVTPDGGPNNVTPDGGNNVTPDGGPNNVVPDAGPNNVTPDMTTTPDMAVEPDACVPEADPDFCERQGAGCGEFTSADNCGVMRTVDCGTCPGGAPCVQNVCDNCMPENDPTFCTRNAAECGVVTALDNCRMERTVNCGGCPGNGVGCTMQNVCVEVDCRDGVDNDGASGADCADPACLGMRCSNNPNQECLANGTCG